jgi:zinc transporter 7
MASLDVFVGFASFFIMEKTLRVLGGEESSGHSHSHSHDENTARKADSEVSGVSSSVVGTPNGLRSRGSDKSNGVVPPTTDKQSHAAAVSPSKFSAYLNLFGDFVHNMYVRVLCAPFFAVHLNFLILQNRRSRVRIYNISLRRF